MKIRGKVIQILLPAAVQLMQMFTSEAQPVTTIVAGGVGAHRNAKPGHQQFLAHPLTALDKSAGSSPKEKIAKIAKMGILDS